MTEKKPNELQLIASLQLTSNNELYKIIDFLNKNLKDRNVVFGLSKGPHSNIMTMAIYKT
ncbi:MAG: YpmA family protein [Peptococcaceae bacterium]|nr:YpmA family protein [Peptococcaceae bacterium]